MYRVVSERDELNYYEIRTERNKALIFSTWMLIVPLLCKNLIAFVRISRRQLIHTRVKGFTAVLTVVFNKLRVLDRQKFPSRNFLSPRLPQKRNWNKVYLFLFSFPFSLWAVLITNLYNVAMNWINWLNYITNVTIHR